MFRFPLLERLLLAAMAALLTGCGLTQSVSEGTASTAKAIFYKQVNTLRLDVGSRIASNTDGGYMDALSVPTIVRVYQLRTAKALERTTYEALLENADTALASDLLAERTLVIKPGAGAQLSEPLDDQAQVVAVVALLRSPDPASANWRLTLSRDQLDGRHPRIIELADNRLTLQPLTQE
jgi:type VI secretion system protein VasD